MQARLGTTGSIDGVPTTDIAALAALAACGLVLSELNGGVGALVVVVVALAIAVAAPLAGVAAVAAAIPTIYHPVPLHGGNWSLLELAIGLAAAGVGSRVALDVLRTKGIGPAVELLQPWPTTVGAAALVLAGAASLVTVADERFRPDSMREFRWVIVEPVLAFFLARWALRRAAGKVLLPAAFVGMGTIVAAAGLGQLVFGSGVVVADGVERVTGPYRHPNNLALYLDRVAIFALALAVALPRWRRWLAPVAAVTAVGLAATLSRGAVLAYVAGGASVVWAVRARHGWRWLAGGAAAVIGLIGVVGADRLTDRGAAGATSSRQLIWEASARMLRDHPITGVGLDQFLSQYNRRYVAPAGWPERYTSHPHNLILDVWLRLGLLGLVAATIVAATVILAAHRGATVTRSRSPLWIAAGAALIAGLVHGLVDNGYFLPDLAVMTWLLIAVLEAAADRRANSPNV